MPLRTGYLYDADGARVAKGTITTMSCDPAANGLQITENYVLGPGGEELTTLDGSNTWQRTNVYVDGRLTATYDLAGLHFHLSDPLGTRRVQLSGNLTSADQTQPLGQAELDCQSLPYGDQQSCTPAPNAPPSSDDATPLHFTGKERDPESGNDYFGARYYASTMGRFMSPDWSAKVEPVPYSKLDNPQTLNLYAYVGNNPLRGVDPDGHEYLITAPTEEDNSNSETDSSQSAADQQTAQPTDQQQTDQQQSDGIAGQINHETLGMKDSKKENESLASAENKIAHVRLNGIKKWGSNEKAQKYASLVSAIEKGPGFSISQQAVEQAIREDSKGIDPTSGAIFYNMRTQSQFKHGGNFQGQKVHTSSGPYISPSKYTYIMTYGPPVQ